VAPFPDTSIQFLCGEPRDRFAEDPIGRSVIERGTAVEIRFPPSGENGL
jgi:hypothetical protein